MMQNSKGAMIVDCQHRLARCCRHLLLAWFLVMFLSNGAVAVERPKALNDDDFSAPAPFEEIKLGQLLFYDPILSGNRNIACATCHHPRFATSDGLSLGLGEGGVGLGPSRGFDPRNAPEQRIPRNSPALFNLSAKSLRVLFHDGRIEVDPSRPSGLRTPLGEDMLAGFSGLLSAQTMFPVLSPDEMAGHYSENDVAAAVRRGVITGEGGAWDILSKRVAAIPLYADLFDDAYPEIADGRPIGFADISNAIAAFIAFEWRADQSQFDRFLREEAPLTDEAMLGMELFYGAAGCSVCHSGGLQTDQRFHAMGEPQLGPGKAARFETHQEDRGRFRVTGRHEDLYAFRTPSLRNVAATGPWGHSGAFNDLGAYIAHHADHTLDYDRDVVLPDLPVAADDWSIMNDQDLAGGIDLARTTPPISLDQQDLQQLRAFLESLTDTASIDGRLGIPNTVPSGLPVDR